LIVGIVENRRLEMNKKRAIYCIGIFLCTILFGWGFVEIMSKFTWMVDRMDYLLWSIIYLSGIIVVCTYVLSNNLKRNYK